MSLPSEAYLWFKSLHIIGVVVWFAGLFYLVRLFIYHVETEELDPSVQEAFKDQYTLMEKRLANIITTPGLILTVINAVGLLYMQPSYLNQFWMQTKLVFVFFLILYHILCYQLMSKLHSGTCLWSGRQLRLLNELPTLLLVIVVLLVVFKNQFPTNAATWLIVGLVVFMALTIQFYARWRRLRKESLLTSDT